MEFFRIFGGIESTEQQADVGKFDRRLTGGDGAFVIFAQAAIASHPRKSPLHHPTFRHRHKSFFVLRTFFYFELPTRSLVFQECLER